MANRRRGIGYRPAVVVRVVAVLALAGLLSGCAASACKSASCEARRLADTLAARGDLLHDRRALFAAAEQSLRLAPCPEGKTTHQVLCAERSVAGRTTELRAALDPADPRESRYTLGLAMAGPGGAIELPELGAPFGRDLAEQPGWVVGGGVLVVRPVAQTLAWQSPRLVGDPLDRLEAEGQPAAPRWGEVRFFLEVRSRWRDDRDPLRRAFEFSPRADDSPRETTKIAVLLRGRIGGEGPDDAARVDTVEISAVRDEADLDPAWVGAWLRDLRFEAALPALAVAAAQPVATDCVRAAKHGNFALAWAVRRQGAGHVHTITVSRRLVANERFAAEPFQLCQGSRGLFTR